MLVALVVAGAFLLVRMRVRARARSRPPLSPFSPLSPLPSERFPVDPSHHSVAFPQRAGGGRAHSRWLQAVFCVGIKIVTAVSLPISGNNLAAD